MAPAHDLQSLTTRFYRDRSSVSAYIQILRPARIPLTRAKLLSQTIPRSKAALPANLSIQSKLPRTPPSLSPRALLLLLNFCRPPGSHLQTLATDRATGRIHQIGHHRRPPVAPFLRVLAADFLQQRLHALDHLRHA
jgi:hypothetical protein